MQRPSWSPLLAFIFRKEVLRNVKMFLTIYQFLTKYKVSMNSNITAHFTRELYIDSTLAKKFKVPQRD